MYRDIFGNLPTDTDQDRVARVAMLAAEAMFMLRGFGLLEISDAEWSDIFQDISSIIPRGSGG
jgi:hypothetical protein